MTHLPMAPCRAFPLCHHLVEGGGWCSEHRHLAPKPKKRKRRAPKRTTAERGYGAKWRRNSQRFLAAHPTCARCSAPSEHAHHKIPKRAGGSDAWENLEALCNPCHGRETAIEKRRYPL